jgi:hypothetical protein
MTFWEIAGALNKPFSPIAIVFVSIDRREEIVPEERINPVFLIKRIFTFHLFFVLLFTHFTATPKAFTFGACSLLWYPDFTGGRA